MAPQPLNGTLLIEVDGSNLSSNAAFIFSGSSDNSTIRGLVVGNFAGGDAVQILADNIQVQGNYIGTNPAGDSAKPNTVGVDALVSNPESGHNALIGGLDPEDRNIISGNTSGSFATGGYPGTGWVIQGNYVGLGADGVSAIPNSNSNGAGAFSVDDSSDVLVGGTETGAANVISGNTSYGLAPDNSPGLTIQGNYIGTDWTGEQAIPNLVGIIISRDQSGTIIGGTTESARNIISGNTLFNVSIQNALGSVSGAVVQGNYIGTNAGGDIDAAITAAQGEGVRISANATGNIIGGENGNRIAGNRGSGVAVRSLTITSFSLTGNAEKNAILGNQIYGNATGGDVPNSQGLGIDIYEATVANASFPADLFTDSTVNAGLTPNDPTDADTGPNGYMNFPVLNSVTQDGTTATINFNLDAADSPTDQYRVEFFSNDTPDPSGYGEGQTFLGYATVSNGNNQTASLNLPSGTNLTGKSISATTTALDNTTDSGFGATSEFSQLVVASVISNNSNTGSLAGTGQDFLAILIAALTSSAFGAALFVTKRRSANSF